jgi:hypothetical protein
MVALIPKAQRGKLFNMYGVKVDHAGKISRKARA